MSDFHEIVFSPLSIENEIGESISSRNERNQEDGEEVGHSTVWGASFNLVNSIVGAGIIGIPLAIQQCGFILGILMLSIVAVLIYHSVLMLIECGVKENKFNLEELAEHLYGVKGYYFALLFMFLFAFGGQTAYLVIIGDTVPQVADLLLPGSFLTNRNNAILFFSVLIILPLCLIRDISKLSWSSFLSISCDVIIIFIVLIIAPTVSKEQDTHFKASDVGEVNYDLFEGVGTMSFAFVCQHSSFIVYRSLQKPTFKNWNRVAMNSITFSFLISLVLGLVGFFSFYPFVKGDLLNNFPTSNISIGVSRGLLALTMVFTYPMECFVARHCLLSVMEKIFHPVEEKVNIEGNEGEIQFPRDLETLIVEKKGFIEKMAPYVISILLFVVTLSIALVTSKLGAVSALTGAVAASVLGYILPALLYLQSYREEVTKTLKTWPIIRYYFILPNPSASVVDLELIEENRDNNWELRVKVILPLLMLFFGFISLVVGVTTVLMQET